MKGNVLVGQSGGPTVVISSSLADVLKTAKEHGHQKVYGMRFSIQDSLDEQYMDLSDYIRNELELELPERTPSTFLGTCRYKLPEIHEDEEVFDRVSVLLDKLDIEVFIHAGGSDSMDTIRKLSDCTFLTGMKQRFVGCPKTIDGDLATADHTPGFGSAAKYTAILIKEVTHSALGFSCKKKNVNVIETMGRNAGWLVGAMTLARQEDCDDPDLIYLPETFFDIEAFVERVTRLPEKKDVIVAAVSEGIRTADGVYVCELADRAHSKSAFEHIQMTSTALYLAGLMRERLGTKARAMGLSTLRHAAAHLAGRVDVDEAFAVRGATIKAAGEGSSGVMVVIDRVSDDPYQSAIGVYGVHRTANGEKPVSHSWINMAGDYVTDKFVSYVEPLIQGYYNPMMVAGLSCHLVVNQRNYSGYQI